MNTSGHLDRKQASEKSDDRLSIILIGLTHPYRGGISLYTTMLYQELSTRHRVHLINFKRLYPSFVFPGRTQYDESKKTFPVASERIIDTLWPFSWLKTARKIVALAPDLVIMQWWQPYLSPVYTAIAYYLKKKIPVAFLCHNVVPHEPTRFDEMLSNFAFRATDALIVHSRVDALKLTTKYPRKLIQQVDHPIYDAFPTTAAAILK
ncbi:glycosyltransferase [candidate division CSSED10-310 bacterium]|uniref:Glycosyltransferase n=1 Tax=candidate division CSSED10-310 bacterium TaxID=2855610 RepID=A0ABV6YWH5_UNCC1